MAVELTDGRLYYAMPVIGGGVATFELITAWANQEDAEAEIERLKAADTERARLATEARQAIEDFEEAADGSGEDDEHAAACDVAEILGALVDALEKSCLLEPQQTLRPAGEDGIEPGEMK